MQKYPFFLRTDTKKYIDCFVVQTYAFLGPSLFSYMYIIIEKGHSRVPESERTQVVLQPRFLEF